MRPMSGTPLRRDRTFQRLLDDLDDPAYVFQPKLNGDRVCVIVWDGAAYAQNRHGRWYSFGIANLKDFADLGNATVLDGEVYRKTFYPFEALAFNGVSLLMTNTTERVAMAEEVCEMLDITWKFGAPTREWLTETRDAEMADPQATPVWEGVVRKNTDAIYTPLGGEGQETDEWFKLKWAV